LDQLKHLTHLRCTPPTDRYQGLEGAIRHILDHCPPSLQVFIVWIHPAVESSSGRPAIVDEIRATQRGDLDIRVVLATGKGINPTVMVNHSEEDSFINYPWIRRPTWDQMVEWTGIEYEKSFWKRAEEMIEGRRRRQREK
jgi:hypothetical protein